MKPTSMKPSLQPSNTVERVIINSKKPPIPPKPNLQSRYRPLSEPKQEFVNVSSDGIISSNYFPSQRYNSYPTAVLIQDDHIPYSSNNEYDYKHTGVSTLESVTSLSSLNYSGEKLHNSSDLPPITIQNILLPLTKAEITPKYAYSPVRPPQVHELNHSRGNSGGRTLSASAKNALLMEKIGGSVYNNDSSKEILPRTSSNADNTDSSSQAVTVNSSCIISVNNFNNSISNNNNYNDIDTKHIRNKQRRSLNLESHKSSVNNELILKPIPAAAAIASVRQDLALDNEERNKRNEICNTCNYYQKSCYCARMKEPTPIYIMTERGNNDIMRNSKEIPRYNIRELENKIASRSSKDSTSIQEEEEDSSCDKTSKLNSVINNASSQSAPCSPATKPVLRKSDAVDMEDYDYYKRLSRGISRATDNVNIVSKARSEIAQGIWEALESGNHIKNTPFFIETPVFTFTLPDLSVYSDEFRQFLEKDLIEMSTLVSLEAAGRLNWWALIGASQRLWPLATTGDGNCLLHAASLGMWGFHDRLLTLRKALHEFLTRSQYSRPLWRRWRWQLALQNRETGLVLSQDEWEDEWASVLRLASSAPRGGPQNQENTTGSAPNLSHTTASLSQGKLNTEISGPVYESLEEIHVLALAHVLRRPIIVVADTTLKDMNGDPLAPIPFGGIYLPLECPPRECQRSPLLLTYDAAHFSALVVMEVNEKEDNSKLPLTAVIPVTDCLHDLLPIQFLVDPGEDFVWGRDELDDIVIKKLTITSQDKKGLLNEYLDLIQVPIPSTYLEASFPSVISDDLSSQDPNDPLVDIDKKSSESSFDSDEGPPLSDGGGGTGQKAKAPKQLQTVVRSFGSIGRSMSKRIKKNLSKLSRSGSFRRKNPSLTKGEYACSKNGGGRVQVGTQQNFILGAVIHTEPRKAYQQEMVENYLATARERFMRDGPTTSQSSKPLDSTGSRPTASGFEESIVTPPDINEKGLMECINAGCNLYGSAQTSYMCTNCFDRQKQEEEKEYQRQQMGEAKAGESQSPNLEAGEEELSYSHSSVTPTQGFRGDGLQYGAGKSKFYAHLDESSVKNATLIPITQTKTGAKDKTIFLSNSTFYNDSVAGSIPSYNLNRDSMKDLGKAGKSGSTVNGNNNSNLRLSSDSSISSRSSSALGEPINIIRVSPTAKDSLAPICIDDVRIQVNKVGGGRGTQKGMISSAGPSKETPTPTLVDTRDGFHVRPKPCLTKGCEFYGSSSTNDLCSKCHSIRKRNTHNCHLQHVRYSSS